MYLGGFAKRIVSSKLVNFVDLSRKSFCLSKPALASKPINVPITPLSGGKGFSQPGIKMKFRYPEARRDDSCFDEYHGVNIQDPYRWLEDPDSEETAKFVDDQNAVTRPYLESCPERSNINARLTELWDFPKYSCPYHIGNRYYLYQNTGLQNQSVMFLQETLTDEPRVFFDPNLLSIDGTVALSSYEFSEDGKSLAYGLSKSGSDWLTIQFKDVETGSDYPEVLKMVKFTPISWTHDHKGIFYGRYPDQEGKTDGSETVSNEGHKLYYHRLGTPQSEDVLVVEFLEEPHFRIGASVTHCGRYLLVLPMRDCRDNLLYYTDLSLLPNKTPTGLLNLTPIVTKLEADYHYITNNGSVCTFLTNKNAPNYRLVNIDLNDPAEDKWTDLIPEHEHDVLDWANLVDGDKLVVCYIKDVVSKLQLNDVKTGRLLKEFEVDTGAISNFSGHRNHSEFFFKFVSFLSPGTIYRCDLKGDLIPVVHKEINVSNFNASNYEIEQVFYNSKDGTRIPMFVVHKKGLVLDGSNPCLLYGYGGFNITVQPSFSVMRLVFMQHFQGVVAVANIRGGGEYGEAWHNAGRQLNKQNVFDDFIAAAEYLVANNFTSKSKLTIQGGSNGGLLVAACVNQRPDLYGAVLAQVGVLDMLRFHKFTIGYAWISDYGSSDDPKHFENLVKYSPMHNIRVPEGDGSQYPSLLLLTADHDDRVVPLHSLKYIATLQHTLKDSISQVNPLMIRIDTKAGHGSGKPTKKLIDDCVDMLCFVMQSLDLKFYA